MIAVVVSAVWGLDPRRAADLVVLFGATYAVERALAEIYKTFLRDEDQSKYFIPMQFAVFGKVVRSRGARLLARLNLQKASVVTGDGDTAWTIA